MTWRKKVSLQQVAPIGHLDGRWLRFACQGRRSVDEWENAAAEMTKTKAKFHSAAFEQLECQKKGEISTNQQVFPMQFIFTFVTTDVTVRRQRFGRAEEKKNDFPSQYLCSRAVTFYLFVQIGLELNKIQFNFTAGRVGERRIVLIGVGFRRLYVEDLPHAQKQSV